MWKKLYRTGLVIITLCVIIVTIAVIYQSSSLNQGESGEVLSPPSYPTTFEYLLKSVDGKVCVYKSGDDMPFETLSVYLDSLPVADRMALINGIEVKDAAALSRLIEDYES